LIAEIGGNPQVDFGKSNDLVSMALECDVDFTKVQTYFADTLGEKIIARDRWAHFKKIELSIDGHVDLAEKHPVNDDLSYLELIGGKVNRDLTSGQLVLKRDICE
tara:strand:- start:1346 stop:1660 length:315 start_codon:yes stop_codon:yes gene_type:complete